MKSKPYLYILILLAGITANLNAHAAGEIISQHDSVEAEKVTVLYSAKSKSGSVRAEGCSKCPLRLEIDSSTVMKYKYKPVRERQVAFLSGKPGAVIFDPESKTATKINWW